MSVASEITRLQGAKADIKTAIEAKGVTVPSNALIDTYNTYIGQISTAADPSPYWTSNWQFKRPAGWPDLDTLWDNSTGYVWFIASFDCRPRIAKPIRTDGFCVYRGGGSNTATIERLKLVDGSWVVANTASLSATGNYAELLPTDEGDYVVYRVTFSSANGSSYYKFLNGNTSNSNFDGIKGTDNNYYYTSTCMEAIIAGNRCMNFPYFRSSYLRRFAVKNFKNYNSTNKFCSAWFRYCTNLEYIDLAFNTANGNTNFTALSYCFADMPSLKKLVLTNWDISNVTKLDYTFYKCSHLEELAIGSWDTAKVTTMTYTFYECASLKTLDTSTWNTAKVTTMAYMFSNCELLESISLAGANTSLVTTFTYMFANCHNLKTLTLGNSFSTAAATTFANMFQYCIALENCPLSGKTLASGLVTTYSNMFYGCVNLKEMDMSGWDLSGVTNAQNAQNVFLYCYGLRKVVLPSSTKAMHANYFSYCNNLETIIVNATTPPTWAATSTYLGRLHPNYKIYVPDASVNTYKSTSGWTNASSHIFSINDLT